MIMDASKTGINQWGVVGNGEGGATRVGYIIVTIYLRANKK